MWNDRIDEQTIALAGLYQACQIVSKIAWNGEYNEQELEPLINCIIKVDATNTENIYLNVSKLESGLVYFRKQIVGDIFTRSSETKRYIASLNKLSDTLMSDNSCINKIQLLLKSFSEKSKSMTIDEKTIELSNIYQQTLSKFEPRIVVNGENKFLTDENHSSRIRTALFAGVRSVILWRQLGGSKLKLLFLKGQFSKQIDNYLDSITN